MISSLIALSVFSAPLAQKGQMIAAPATPESGLALTKAYSARPAHTEFATFAAGCFWGVEEEFRKTRGVVATMVGYSGGHVKNVDYKLVCTDTTGHAESVRIEFDPKVVSYARLCQVFWDLHDPTTLNRQGPDIGEQYRSVIFYSTAQQKKTAEATKRQLQASGELGKAKIVTEIVPVQAFYRAEEYHQQYVEKGGIAYCHPRKKQ